MRRSATAAELICRNYRAEKQLDVFFDTVEVSRLLPCPLLLTSPLSKALEARNIG